MGIICSEPVEGSPLTNQYSGKWGLFFFRGSNGQVLLLDLWIVQPFVKTSTVEQKRYFSLKNQKVRSIVLSSFNGTLFFLGGSKKVNFSSKSVGWSIFFRGCSKKKKSALALGWFHMIWPLFVGYKSVAPPPDAGSTWKMESQVSKTDLKPPDRHPWAC